ncbi:hypothetical protein [Bradyrhizobium cosmicum]|uniref:hypothetical protein n=1 Tax=Bradyrhizobium cosmicum TaxID=1404864 RepID=UPI0028F0013E|nr:hypothetical protein [Bradyrhizobium cosmicum]
MRDGSAAAVQASAADVTRMNERLFASVDMLGSTERVGIPVREEAMKQTPALSYDDFRNECYDAMFNSYVGRADVGSLIEDIFISVTKAIKRHFPETKLQTIDMILRDARNEAEDLLDDCDLENFVDLDDVIKTIAEYLTEEDAVTAA